MMEEGDSIANTIQLPTIDWREIIDQVVERTEEKRQQHINQLTDMISTLTSLIFFHIQQQQVPNSSAHDTPTVALGLLQMPVIILLPMKSHLVIK